MQLDPYRLSKLKIGSSVRTLGSLLLKKVVILQRRQGWTQKHKAVIANAWDGEWRGHTGPVIAVTLRETDRYYFSVVTGEEVVYGDDKPGGLRLDLSSLRASVVGH